MHSKHNLKPLAQTHHNFHNKVQALFFKYEAAFSEFVTKKLNSMALVHERTIPTGRPPPVGEVSANFLRIEGCHVVSATDPHGR
jgi:hypothetical protein